MISNARRKPGEPAVASDENCDSRPQMQLAESGRRHDEQYFPDPIMVSSQLRPRLGIVRSAQK